MRVALFVPCYVDQLAPDVGWASVELLERHGCAVEFPRAQTCCGQPLHNAGHAEEARSLARRFVATFARCEAIVAPSGSCVAMVRRHFAELLGESDDLARVRARTFELCEFLHDVLGLRRIDGRFERRVALHRSCHGVRELGLATPSERIGPRWDKVATLLRSLQGIELVDFARADECCGFGGSFAVKEEAVACAMGRDKLDACVAARADVVASTDVSCLLHLDGLARREGRALRTMHVAEILTGSEP